MKRYDRYKDSGIEWIGEIPSHWEVKRFKYLFELMSKREERDLPKIGLENIESWTGKYIKTETDFEGDGDIFSPMDILFGKLRPYLAKVYLAEFFGKAVGDIFVFRPKSEIKPEYGSQLLLSQDFINLTTSSTFGAKMPRVSWEFISNQLIPIPPLFEQTVIITYLKQKTIEVDSLIADKKCLLELYEEEKTAIINQAVTKGINPDAPMKDSGIEWLSDIPEHWDVKRLKYVLSERLKYGANESAEEEILEHPRYIRITDFGNDGKLKCETFKSLPPEKAENYLLIEGDILLARSGATVGKTFQFKSYEGIACFAGYLIKATPNPFIINSDFLYFFTKSGVYENWKSSIFNQATIQNIGADKYAFLEIPIPLLEEQQSIVQHIETECARIDAKIAKTKKLIELLTEYRTALISEVVTGKIKVTE